MGLPSGSVVKNPPANAGDTGNTGLIPGSEESEGGKGSLEEVMASPLQYSCLENTMDKGAWQTVVHGSQRSQT